MESMPFAEEIDPSFRKQVKDALLQELERYRTGDPAVEGGPLAQLGNRFADWEKAFMRGQSLITAAEKLNGDYWSLNLDAPTGYIMVELDQDSQPITPEALLIEQLVWARIDPTRLPVRWALFYSSDPLPDVDRKTLREAYEAVRHEILWDTTIPQARGTMTHVTMDYLIDGMINGQIGVGFRHEAV